MKSARSGVKDFENRYSKVNQIDGNLTDEDAEARLSLSNDEFGDHRSQSNRLVRTGRQRKKLAARSKGGEFQTRRRKKRVYFCCVSSDIDVQKLFDYLVGAGGLLHGWRYRLYNDVLHLYKAGVDDITPHMPASKSGTTLREGDELTRIPSIISDNDRYSVIENSNIDSKNTIGSHKYTPTADHLDYNMSSTNRDSIAMRTTNSSTMEQHMDMQQQHQQRLVDILYPNESTNQQQQAADSVAAMFRISSPGAQEVFVFDFGAVVFWGFSRGEETNLLKTIRMFVTKGFVEMREFQSGEDDMAFVTSEAKIISIANDVISLPEDSMPKQRLSVSFAIAQSSVLAIFEARIERKVEEYKYIPEALATYGKVHLSERQLGMMIGDVFVIRHDVNLHTEILDTPDFFWNEKEEKFEQDYKMVLGYLEMSGRTEILNKRLDMLRELLDVLQQQMENAHAVKLEWIVIYLIIVEVVLQCLMIINK